MRSSPEAIRDHFISEGYTNCDFKGIERREKELYFLYEEPKQLNLIRLYTDHVFYKEIIKYGKLEVDIEHHFNYFECGINTGVFWFKHKMKKKEKKSESKIKKNKKSL